MRRRKTNYFLIILIVAVLAAAAAAVIFISGRPDTEPSAALEHELSLIVPEYSAQDAAGGKLADAAKVLFKAEPVRVTDTGSRSAEASVRVTRLDTSLLTADLNLDMQSALAPVVASASRPSEIYDENDRFLPDLAEDAYDEALEVRLAAAESCCVSVDVPVALEYVKGEWLISGLDDVRELARGFVASMPGYAEALEKLEYIPLHYSLPDLTGPGPKPDSGCFGETQDAALVAELLSSPKAQRLINGQELDWNKNRGFLPGRSIYYYLDDSMLAIVWQEEEQGAVGTFAEVIVSDVSQLRRKIAGDKYGTMTWAVPTELAAQANAVLAVSGDYYINARPFGVYVYDGKVMKSHLTDGDTCYFDRYGDMLFSYGGTFSSAEEAQAFVDENGVMFSLNFGPVIMDKGRDVVPDDYYFGEIKEGYARCAIGQLGKLHYLAMTINVEPDYPEYVTLRQAADSIISHGVYNAYTLDGGQTGSIILNNELRNPVQFGKMREMSDVFYFATAIPAD